MTSVALEPWKQLSMSSARFGARGRNLVGASRAPRAKLPRLRPLKKKGKSSKLVIKPFKVKPTVPENYAQDTITALMSAVRCVFTKQPTKLSEEQLYGSVESLCMHKHSEALYSALEALCNSHHLHLVGTMVTKAAQISSVHFLSWVCKTWLEHCQHLLRLRGIFLYLDRTYTSHLKIRSLWELFLKQLRTQIAAQPSVLRKTTDGLLELVRLERNLQSIDRALVKDTVRMLSSLHQYRAFEAAFIVETRSFYHDDSAILRDMTVAKYVRHVNMRIENEEQRTRAYLETSTALPASQTTYQALVGDHVDVLISKGLVSMMTEEDTQSLGLLYRLLEHIKATATLTAALEAYVITTGDAIVNDAPRQKELVRRLLKWKAALDKIHKESFQSNELCWEAVKVGFEKFLNMGDLNKVPELLAKFVDIKLCRASKGMNEAEKEQTLDRVMFIFTYLRGKDVFQAFYRRDLGKRLLLRTSASIDLEKSMISKMKQECGPDYTRKFESMFKDMSRSQEHRLAFCQHLTTSNTALSSELHVEVLTHGCWPNYLHVPLKLPSELRALQTTFRTWYLGNHNARKLVWQDAMGTCQLMAHFAPGKKEMLLSAQQATICLLFNEATEYTLSELGKHSGMQDVELKRTLLSLITVKKGRILLKTPPQPPFNDTDIFRVNTNFKHQLFRIKMNGNQLRETETERKQTTKTVFQNRLYSLDALVVRIMKARKTLPHSVLMSEVFQQIKYPCTPTEVKARIQELLVRDYLVRDTANGSVYHYQA